MIIVCKVKNDTFWNHYTVKSRYLEVDGIIFYKSKLPEVQISPRRQIMVEKSN